MFETALARGIAVLFLNFIIARIFNIDIDFKDAHNLKFLNQRNIIVTLQGIIYTLSNFYLPLPIVSTLNCTGPIFIFVLDYYMNGTKLFRSQIYGVLIGLAGVIFTVNGAILLSFLD